VSFPHNKPFSAGDLPRTLFRSLQRSPEATNQQKRGMHMTSREGSCQSGGPRAPKGIKMDLTPHSRYAFAMVPLGNSCMDPPPACSHWKEWNSLIIKLQSYANW